MEKTRKFTRNLMAKFPSWMKMSKDSDSIGAKFLDVFGISFQDFEEEMDYVVNNFYAKTADVDMVDILYKVPVTESVITDFTSDFPHVQIVEKDGSITSVEIAEKIRHLYSRKANLPIALLNREDGYLYLRMNLDNIEDRENPFQQIEIDGAIHYKIEFHHVWNAFDEFGFLLGLSRLPLEKNKEYKNRILDVFKNPGSNTKKGIQNGVSRELGIEKEKIDVFSLNKEKYGNELINVDGSPTAKMREYAKSINENLKFTIDTLNLGEAYWHSLEQDNIGIYFLPHIWDIDSSLFESKEYQSGIGFEDDLKVTKPKEGETTLRDFVMNVSLVGYYEDFEEFYPEISFEYKIYAEGKLLENSYEEESFKYTVLAAENFNQDYSIVASQDFVYLHEVLFGNKNDFKKDDALEFLEFTESNVFLNKQTDDLLRLSLYLNTNNSYQSNKISDMKIYWEDTSGKEHVFSFDSRDKWINPQKTPGGKPTSTPVTSGTYYNESEKSLELGKGNFSEEIETTSDFMRGRYDTNFIIIEKGTLSLNIKKINQIM